MNALWSWTRRGRSVFPDLGEGLSPRLALVLRVQGDEQVVAQPLLGAIREVAGVRSIARPIERATSIMSS
jgi:hypothetical protein